MKNVIDEKIQEETKALVKTTKNSAFAIKVNSQPTLELAQEILREIGNTKKTIETQKRKQLDPLNESRKAIIEFFKPFEEDNSESEKYVKGEMKKYLDKVEEAEVGKKEAIEEKVKSGEMSIDQAANKIEKVEQKKEAVNYRVNKKVVIKDKSKIPAMYFELNEVLLRKDALAGVEIPGVEIEEEKTIVNK